MTFTSFNLRLRGKNKIHMNFDGKVTFKISFRVGRSCLQDRQSSVYESKTRVRSLDGRKKEKRGRLTLLILMSLYQNLYVLRVSRNLIPYYVFKWVMV